jgi:hypothetical protein
MAIKILREKFIRTILFGVGAKERELNNITILIICAVNIHMS